MNASIRDHVLIVAVAAVVVFTNLGGVRLWDRDEPRNAGCAAEMLQRNDWIVPVFNARLRTHKPVLLYWLMMSAYAIFGVNEFAARFWSAALGIGTVVVTYHAGRRLFDAAAGRWAAIVLATALMFDVAARAATPDSALIFFSTLGLAGFVFTRFRPAIRDRGLEGIGPVARNHYEPLSWWAVVCTYAPLGLAVLAKGPVGVVLPVAVMGMFLLIVRLPEQTDDHTLRDRTLVDRIVSRLRLFAPDHFVRTLRVMRPVAGGFVVLAVALPWYLWVGVRTEGAWLQEFFLQHNVGRAIAPMEGHDGGWWYYPVTMLIGLFPWSILAVPVLVATGRSLRQRDGRRDAYVFCVCWAGVQVALFSLARTKLPSYVTPAYPAIALLIGVFLRQWTADGQVAWRGWLRTGWATLSVVGLAVVVGVLLTTGRYLPGEYWLAVLGVIPMVGGVIGWVLTESQRRPAAAAALAGTALLFSVGLLAVATARVDRHQQTPALLQAIATAADHPRIAAYASLEPSWVFYAGQPIRYIPPGKPQLALAFLRRGPQQFLITTDAEFRRLQPQLPHDVARLASVPYFLKNATLVLVGPTSPPTRLANPRVHRLPTR